MTARWADHHAVQGDSSQGFKLRFSCIVAVARRQASDLVKLRRHIANNAAAQEETE
jgi:hypothetical protein